MAAENDIETEAIVMGISPKIAWQLQLVAGIITLVLGAILLGVWFLVMGVLMILGGLFIRSDLKKADVIEA